MLDFKTLTYNNHFELLSRHNVYKSSRFFEKQSQSRGHITKEVLLIGTAYSTGEARIPGRLVEHTIKRGKD